MSRNVPISRSKTPVVSIRIRIRTARARARVQRLYNFSFYDNIENGILRIELIKFHVSHICCENMQREYTVEVLYLHIIRTT